MAAKKTKEKSATELLSEANIAVTSYEKEVSRRPIRVLKLTGTETFYAAGVRRFIAKTGEIEQSMKLYVKLPVAYKYGPWYRRKTGTTDEFYEVCISVWNDLDNTEHVGEELEFDTATELIKYVNNLREFRTSNG